MTSLKGQVALVTGGGTGIGKGVVEALAARGITQMAIAAADYVEHSANQYKSKNIGGYTAARNVCADLQKKGVDAIAIETDITKPADVQNMVKTTLDRFGRIDILVHVAGLITCKTGRGLD